MERTGIDSGYKPDIKVNFFGLQHQPLNLQGAARAERVIRDIATTPEPGQVVYLEHAGFTPDQAHTARQRFRYRGFRTTYMEGLLPELLRRKPTDREVRERINHLDELLDRKDVGAIWVGNLLGPNSSLFNYVLMRDLDILRTNDKVRLELESHSPRVNQQEKAVNDEYIRSRGLAAAAWRNHDYVGFLEAAQPTSISIFKSSNIRDMDITQQLIPRLEQMVRTGQAGTLTLLFGPSHQLDRYLQAGLSPDVTSAVSFSADRGDYENNNESQLIKRLRNGESPSPILDGKFIVEMYAMEALAKLFVNRGWHQNIAYAFETYQSALSNLVAALTDKEMRDICEGKIMLEAPNLESDRRIYLAINAII